MIKKRLGKDLLVRWPILSNGKPLPLEGRKLSLKMTDPLHHMRVLPYSVEGNTLIFNLAADYQQSVGDYTFTLWEHYGTVGQTCVDSCEPIRLVSSTCMECDLYNGLDQDTVDLPQSDIEVGVYGGGTVTKEQVEQVLTGDITSHNHSTQIAEALASALANYVQKTIGKDLSTNDFTNDLKAKLQRLENYDDAAIQQAIQTINTRIDTLVGTSASTAIDTFREIEAFLQGITDSQSLTAMLNDLKREITALIPSTEALATKEGVKAVENKIPTTTSQLLNDSNFVADAHYQHTDCNYTQAEKDKLAKMEEGGGTPVTPGTTDYSQLKNKPSIGGHELTGDKTLHELGIQPEGDYALISDIPDTSGFAKSIEVKKKNDQQDEKLRTLEGEIGKAIDHGIGDTTFELTPNDLHVWGEVASLNLTLQAPTEGNEYNFQFTSGTQPTTLSLPSEIKWIGSDAIEANKTYQVSILNNLAVLGGV